MKLLLLVSMLLVATLPAGARSQPPASCAQVEPLLVSFDGPVEAVGLARWQVAGQTLDVDAATVIDPAGGGTMGDWALVSAWRRLDGALEAVRIVTAPAAPPAGPPLEFTGIVEAIDPVRWTVGGIQVAVTPETVLVGQAAAGSMALVQAKQTGALPLAYMIAAAPPGVDPLFLDGVLLEIVGSLWRMQVGTSVVEVDVADAYVQGAPAVGRTAQAMVLEQAGRPAQALYAAIPPVGNQRDYFGGRLLAQISATQPEQWLLLAASEQGPWLEVRTLIVDRLAIPIDETGGPAVPGAWLEASASIPLWPQQPWVAHSLRVDLGPQATVQGAIFSASEGWPARWQVGDVCVIVDEQTALTGRPRTERYAIAQGARFGPAVLWANAAAVKYRFEGVLVDRLSHVTPPVWVILVTPPAHVDASTPTRVYLTIDATSHVDPSLLSGVLGVTVAVQARAGHSGWLADWVDDPASPWQPSLPAGIDSSSKLGS